ncbi:MAG: hypothetical protein AB9842_00975 [Bacteroidales bacterium]
MKFLPYVTAGLILAASAISFFYFKSPDIAQMLLIIAGFMLLITIVFRKQLAKK